MRLLLVEDDPRLSQYMVEALTREGYSVEVCVSIDEAEAYMAASPEGPRIIILDRMLGRLDGATLIPKFKARYPEAGILILSSLDMPSEKARIIDAGADEYVPKPFSLDELTARLRLVLRRSKPPTTSGTPENTAMFINIGNLCMDLRGQKASVDSHKLDLTRKEFQLLMLFAESPGRVYNRFQILDRVWEIERTTESNVVETTIKNLRRKLEEIGCQVKIESKRNVGYWIAT